MSAPPARGPRRARRALLLWPGPAECSSWARLRPRRPADPGPLRPWWVHWTRSAAPPAAARPDDAARWRAPAGAGARSSATGSPRRRPTRSRDWSAARRRRRRGSSASPSAASGPSISAVTCTGWTGLPRRSAAACDRPRPSTRLRRRAEYPTARRRASAGREGSVSLASDKMPAERHARPGDRRRRHEDGLLPGRRRGQGARRGRARAAPT